ncbi:MAG: hypothetical protein ABI699_04040 [Caldimonas sp.]
MNNCPSQRRVALRYLVPVLLALVTAAGCGGGDGGGAPAPVVPQTIGVAGGTVSGGGASVTVPAGALAAATPIAIEASSVGAPALPAGVTVAGSMFAFTPHGTSFLLPVTVSIPADPARVPAGQTGSLYKTDAAGAWQTVAAASFSGGLATAQVASFSWFVFAAALPTAAPAGAVLAGGGHSSFAVLADGTLRSWGANGPLSVGLGDASFVQTMRESPGPVPGLTNVVALSSSYGNTLALRRNGEVWGWGGNSGNLGDGTMVSTATPVRFIGTPALGAARAVAAGDRHSLVLRADGRIEASGANGLGQLGNPAFAATTTGIEVVQAAGMGAVVAIAAGFDFSLALDEDGTVWAWGVNSRGQLGFDGSVLDSPLPQRVPGLGPMRAIAAFRESVLAIGRDGQVWSWGIGQNLGREWPVPFGAPPGRVELPGPAIALATGLAHAVVLLADGSVYTWGSNQFGYLGTGSPTPSYQITPVRIVGLPADLSSVAAGDGHSLALAADGRVWAWGNNDSGQLGDATNAPRALPFAIPNLNLH